MFAYSFVVEGEVRSLSSRFKPYVVCVENIGLLCLLENGKYGNHSYWVTDILLDVELQLQFLSFLIAECGFSASHLERTAYFIFIILLLCINKTLLKTNINKPSLAQRLIFTSSPSARWDPVKWGSGLRAGLWWSVDLTHQQSPRKHETLSEMKSTRSRQREDDWWVNRGKEMCRGRSLLQLVELILQPQDNRRMFSGETISCVDLL